MVHFLITEISALERLLEPVRDCLITDVAKRRAGLRADEATQARLDLLAGRIAHCQLAAEKWAERDAYMRAGSFIAFLQAKVCSFLDIVPPARVS